MVIEIKKHADGYTAFVTPPTSKAEWATAEPMSEQELWKALYEVKCHMVAIGDAFADADPQIRQKYREARRRNLVDSVGEKRATEIEQKVEADFREQEELYRKYGHDEQAYLQARAELIRERDGADKAEFFLKSAEEGEEYRKRTGYYEQQQEYANRTQAFRRRLKEENPDHPHGA